MADTSQLFVIRHQPSRTWWGPDKAGYTGELARAGTYSADQARGIERMRGEDLAIPLDIALREYVKERFGNGNPAIIDVLITALKAASHG